MTGKKHIPAQSTIIHFSGICLFFIMALTISAALAAVPGNQPEEDFKWEEAAKFVDTLPFKASYIDSIKAAYDVVFPKTPLRIQPQKCISIGETLVYDVGWGPFKAGYVILTATPDKDGKTIKLGGKALSNGFVSSFYRMRDYVISVVDAQGLYPLFFEQHLREGKKYRSDGWILYDHARNKIHVKDRKVKTLDAPNFPNDYLSVLYNVRSRDFKPGDTFALPLYADKKIHSIYFFCRGRKTLTINGKDTIRCLLVEPKLVGNKGAFNKKDKLEVWVSDDDRKIPVEIKSKINIGYITARLVTIKSDNSTFTNFTPASPSGDSSAAKNAPLKNDSATALKSLQGTTGSDTIPETAPEQ